MFGTFEGRRWRVFFFLFGRNYLIDLFLLLFFHSQLKNYWENICN